MWRGALDGQVALVSLLYCVLWLGTPHTSTASNTEGNTSTTPREGMRDIEGRLLQHVMDQFQSTDGVVKHRPVVGNSEPVLLTFVISVIQFLEFDQKKQKLTTQLWQRMIWKDHYVSWDPADFGGLTSTNVRKTVMWTPDIVLYNTFGEPRAYKDDVQAIMYNDGTVTWIPLVIYDSVCKVDVTNFPFDTQVCELRFGSWTYNTEKLDIIIDGDHNHVDLSNYMDNVEWSLFNVTVARTQKQFDCCPENYTIVTFTFHIRRNSGYYVRVMLLPVVALSILSIFVFCIPPQRPDRTSVGLSLFTSFMLLLLLIVDISPPSSSPKLGMYLTACIGVVTSTIVISIIFIHISTWKGKVPRCIRQVILVGLSRVLFPCTLQDTGYSPTAGKASEWVQVVHTLDRLMFILYTVGLAVCIAVYFPMPE